MFWALLLGIHGQHSKWVVSLGLSSGRWQSPYESKSSNTPSTWHVMAVRKCVSRKILVWNPYSSLRHRVLPTQTCRVTYFDSNSGDEGTACALRYGYLAGFSLHFGPVHSGLRSSGATCMLLATLLSTIRTSENHSWCHVHTRSPFGTVVTSLPSAVSVDR